MHRRLSFAVGLITVATVCLFLAKRWFPPLASAEGVFVDRQFHVALAVVGALFVLAQVVLAVMLLRYRERGRSAQDVRGSAVVEWAWVVVVLIILGALGLAGARALAATRNFAEQNTIALECTGVQFQWYFRYSGADGKFGAIEPKLIDASVGNPLGIDPEDEEGRDDVVSSYAVVPLGHTIDVSLRAQDVIHSFFMPAMRIKQDAVPGLNPHVRFTPVKTGSYEVACAELCGLGHYRMNTRVNVVSEREYEAWLAAHARSTR